MAMAFNRSGSTYEGLQFGPALGMAMLEASGIRKMIDKEVPNACTNLSTGMAAKAMIGTMFTEGMRKPLYRVKAQYATAPVDKLFGPYVKHASLSDTSLASRLDTIFGMDMDGFLWKCREKLCGIYGLTSDAYCMDATNFPFYGASYHTRNDPGALPIYSKNSKTKRYDLMQKCVQGICDGNGVLAYTRSYDGNTSDIEMNRDSLEFLKERIDCSRSIVSADCKLCTGDLIKRMIDSDIGFITKVPSSFSGKIRGDIINSAVTGVMDDVGGKRVYDTDARVDDDANDIHAEMRFVAYRLPDSISDAERFLREQGLKDMEKRMTSLKRNAYFCEDDARKAFDEAVNGGYAPSYNVNAVYEDDKRLKRKDPDGPHWRIRPGDVAVNENVIGKCAERYSVNVLITNLPRKEHNSVNLRNGANAEGIVDMYLNGFTIEHAFKLMKSGTGVGHMFIHTPSRQDAVVFLSSLATMISNVANAVMKRMPDMKEMTMKHISDFMMTTIVRYCRENDEKSVTGGPGATEAALAIVDALNIDPELLLGY
jgi:transposase